MANETATPKKNKNKGLLFALVGVGLLATTVGGVFAANSITINDGNAIEFGQGLASTDTCDEDLTAAISQAYDATDDKFYADEITVSGIKDFACAGKNIHVSLIGDTGSGQGVVCGVDGTTLNTDKFLIVDAGSVGSDDDIEKVVTIASSCDATKISKVAITTS